MGFEAITNSEFAEVLPHSVLAGSGHVLSKQKHAEFWKGWAVPVTRFDSDTTKSTFKSQTTYQK